MIEGEAGFGIVFIVIIRGIGGAKQGPEAVFGFAESDEGNAFLGGWGRREVQEAMGDEGGAFGAGRGAQGWPWKRMER